MINIVKTKKKLIYFENKNNTFEDPNLTRTVIWRPPSLSKLTPIIFNTGLTHLGSEASISSEESR